MFPVETAAGRIAVFVVAVLVVLRVLLWSKRAASGPFVPGLLAGASIVLLGLHPINNTSPELVRAITFYPVITLFPVTTPAGKIAVIAVAIAVLIGFLVWSKRATSDAFFRGVLAGMGLVLSFDIVWVHWIFGLHHVTNTQMDLVLEPVLVLAGLGFLWFGITRERPRSIG